jgi:2-dehydropantoate 2-reductase
MRILVLGAGSVGLYFGGRLAQSGAEVSVVARSDYETAVRSGYDVSSIAGDFHFTPHLVLKNAADYPGVADYVILTTKVLPTVDRVALLRPAIRSKDTVIVLIQNGIDIEDEIRTAFPDNELLSTIAYIGASRPSSGKVLHQGSGVLQMGVYPRGISPALKRLADAFNASKVKCEMMEDIVFTRWNKLLWNLPYNPVSVLAGGADTSRMSNGGELEKLCSDLMSEVIHVANAAGVALTEELAEKQREFTRNFPSYKTSMLQDYEAGRALEVDAILGNTLRVARRFNVDVPHIECCYALLKSVDELNRAR